MTKQPEATGTGGTLAPVACKPQQKRATMDVSQRVLGSNNIVVNGDANNVSINTGVPYEAFFRLCEHYRQMADRVIELQTKNLALIEENNKLNRLLAAKPTATTNG